jgi:hypothetical protein
MAHESDIEIARAGRTEPTGSIAGRCSGRLRRRGEHATVAGRSPICATRHGYSAGLL